MPRTFDDFDNYAADYRDIHNKNIKISGAKSDYFAEFKIIEIKKNEKSDSLQILDFGCGDGNSAGFFNKHFRQSIYHGIDISPKSIEEANREKISECHFHLFDGKKIPFTDETFDIVFIACVFHHITFNLHSGILHEIRRVLKKNGRVYFFEHNPYNPVTKKVVNDCPFDKAAVLLSPVYSKNIFKETGLREITVNYIIFFPRFKFFKLFLPMENFLTWLPAGAQYYIKAIK